MTATLIPPKSGARRRVGTKVGLLLAALGLAVLAAAASLAFGNRAIGWHDLLAGLSGLVTGVTDGSLSQAAVAKRVPRTVLALIAGAGLGLAGAVAQGVTRNPLADLGILGVTNGAALFVVVGITFFGLSSPGSYVWVAIAGSALAAVAVYSIGSAGRGGPTPLKLTLAGAATSAAFSALISALLLPRIDVMNQYRFWQIGGVGGADYTSMGQVAPFLIVGTLLCLLTARGLNSLALGDDVAAGLGEHVDRTRLLAGLGAVTLCGAITAVAGPIGFVGLVVPHVCRLLIGIDHRWLLPMSMILGASLLTTADVVGRMIARPSEVDVGIVTAFIGAPVFIYLVRRQKLRSL